jgi:DNA-binding winged helix-turn-helix (wHTH) protein
MLLRDGRSVPLPPKVFDTLLVLVENCGHLLEKDRLITTLWPNTFVEEATLARNISDLRKELGETS